MKLAWVQIPHNMVSSLPLLMDYSVSAKEMKLAGVLSANPVIDRSIRRNRPVRTFPGPISRKVVMPVSIMAWIDSAHLTLDVS